MSVRPREVKNKRNKDGILTGKPGIVYDVNIKYNSPEGKKTHEKRGFITKSLAEKYEITMKAKFQNEKTSPLVASKANQKLKDYLESWILLHGKNNLRPSTAYAYKNIIEKHIVPTIGNLRLKQITPEAIDNMYLKLLENGLSNSTVKYTQRVLDVALEHARKYHYIETNPSRDTITKIGKPNKTPDPYNVEQLNLLMDKVSGIKWEMMVVLGGLYGLRISEILGLRLQNIDMEKGTFIVVEQLPFNVSIETKIVKEMAPTKSSERHLPITDITRPFFEKQFELRENQKTTILEKGGQFFENNLLVAKPNGEPYRREYISSKWKPLIKNLELPHLRFHDLRHSAATNMHQLTGDFFTVAEVLGHTLKGIGQTLGMCGGFDATTAQYIDVRLERKRTVLDIYHKATFPPKAPEVTKSNNPVKRKSDDMEL